MENIWHNTVTGFLAQSWPELLAALCAVMYLVLVIRENIWCWLFAFISTALYTYIFYQVYLFSESLLSVYYLLMAIYGWWQWTTKKPQKPAKIHHWSVQRHVMVLALIVLLTPLPGWKMQQWGGAYPYMDAFVAISSVCATLMVAYKVFENWYYWLLIDLLSIYLFWQKQLYPTVLLYVVYVVLIFIGIKQWKKALQQQTA